MTKFQIPTYLRYSIYLSIIIFAISLRYSVEDIVTFIRSFNRSSPSSNPPLFGEIQFNPADRFELDNIKYTWMVFGVVVVILSVLLGF